MNTNYTNCLNKLSDNKPNRRTSLLIIKNEINIKTNEKGFPQNYVLGIITNLIKFNTNSIKLSYYPIKTSDIHSIFKLKINDILCLLKYLKPENQKFYHEYLSKFN